MSARTDVARQVRLCATTGLLNSSDKVCPKTCRTGLSKELVDAVGWTRTRYNKSMSSVQSMVWALACQLTPAAWIFLVVIDKLSYISALHAHVDGLYDVSSASGHNHKSRLAKHQQVLEALQKKNWRRYTNATWACSVAAHCCWEGAANTLEVAKQDLGLAQGAWSTLILTCAQTGLIHHIFFLVVSPFCSTWFLLK
jgi:hypothetical protein